MLAIAVRMLRNKKGQSLVEYGILVGAIAIVCLVAATLLGHKTGNLLGSTAAALPSVEAEDAGPVFMGKLVKVQQGADGSLRLSATPGTFTQNLGITNAQNLVTDE